MARRMRRLGAIALAGGLALSCSKHNTYPPRKEEKKPLNEPVQKTASSDEFQVKVSVCDKDGQNCNRKMSHSFGHFLYGTSVEAQAESYRMFISRLEKDTDNLRETFRASEDCDPGSGKIIRIETTRFKSEGKKATRFALTEMDAGSFCTKKVVPAPTIIKVENQKEEAASCKRR